MNKLIILVSVFFLSLQFGHSQNCVHDHEMDEIQKEIHKYKHIVQAAKSHRRVAPAPPVFTWPLRQAEGFNDPSYYRITNYVDLDPGDGTLDYNCGNRTYDGHRGIDIAITPFRWNKMDDNQVEVIAAAPGWIASDPRDEGFDRYCARDDDASWNVVVIEHADGSLAYYGHLKTGSVTIKGVGDYVERGEYLGIVGSSGKSTGPHLHFEYRDENGNVREPFAGDCNGNLASAWQNQLPYYDTDRKSVV